MGDWLDRVQTLEQLERDHAISAQRARPIPTGLSRTHCMDCEQPIPEVRRALGGMVRCTPCQANAERGQI